MAPKGASVRRLTRRLLENDTLLSPSAPAAQTTGLLMMMTGRRPKRASFVFRRMILNHRLFDCSSPRRARQESENRLAGPSSNC